MPVTGVHRKICAQKSTDAVLLPRAYGGSFMSYMYWIWQEYMPWIAL